MECVLLLFLFLILSLLASGIGARLATLGQGNAYESLVRRFGGTYQGGRLLRRRNVRFRYGQTWVLVTPGARRGRHRSTQVMIRWPDSRLELRLESRTTAQSPATASDPHRVSLGDAEFDRRYRVTGPHADEIRQWLSDGVRWQVNKISRSVHPSPIRISIRHGRLLVEQLMHIKRPEELHEFTQQCLELYDQAMLTRSEGIEFVGDAHEAIPVENPICQVCGEPITSDMVFCRRCLTPHHLDCWQYNGLCSTYGCRETRFQIPTVAQPVRSKDKNQSSPG
ncbi:MAG: RING finger protein [Pirellulaceae bacterium]